MSRKLPALVFGLAGGLAGLSIFAVADRPLADGWQFLPLVTAFTSALLAFAIWPRLNRSPTRPLLRGGLTGALIAALVYPLAWFLILVGYWAATLGSATGREIIPPWTAVPAALLYGAVGITLTGWFTLPIGIVAGCALAYYLRRTGRSGGPIVPAPHVG